jgi:hypothetical protein
MNIAMEDRMEWCVIRHRDGRRDDIVKGGYRSQENAQRSIPGISKRMYEQDRDATATYAVGMVCVPAPTPVTKFHKYIGCPY